MANRLVDSTSPYLVQHADNPVDWWGLEALAVAQELDRPILLSVGYAACHWCHVDDPRGSDSDVIAKALVRAIFWAA